MSYYLGLSIEKSGEMLQAYSGMNPSLSSGTYGAMASRIG
jgi:hypothetical protein